jgi:RNA polymerase subunit RPABC4/transcription elongation factor Spt4
MSNPTSEITEKSEEEIAKEKEIKAKARYAKRY